MQILPTRLNELNATLMELTSLNLPGKIKRFFYFWYETHSSSATLIAFIYVEALW